MKKQLLFSLLLLLGFAGQAQEGKFKIGLQAGANLSDFQLYRTDELPVQPDKQHPVISWQLGLTADYQLVPEVLTLSLQPMWTSRGFESRIPTATPPDAQTKLHYIDLPLLLRYSTPSKVFLEAGPVLGLRVGLSTNVDGAKAFLDETYSRYEFGLAAGVGYAVTERLAFSLRAFHSLRDAIPEAMFTDINGETLPTKPVMIARSVQLVGTYGLWGHKRK